MGIRYHLGGKLKRCNCWMGMGRRPPEKFDAWSRSRLLERVVASDVIEQIEKLPPEERAKVIDFARNASKRRALTPDELGRLGEQMLASQDKAAAERLRQELVDGFLVPLQKFLSGRAVVPRRRDFFSHMRLPSPP